MKIVTLITDFGDSDGYVAEMKGSLLAAWARLRSDAPAPIMIDVTHAIPRHDVWRASRVLDGVRGSFPPGTVHIVVVDPGVGSSRSPLAIRAGGQGFIGPDNGCLTPALDQPDARTVIIDPRWRRPGTVSRVFDGRDLFAPAAAAFLADLPIDDLGRPALETLRLAPPEASYHPRGASGVVVMVDRFGNARTSLVSSRIPVGAVVRLGPSREGRVVDAYADLDAGEVGGVRSSDGSLEIALREGDAATALDLKPGARVEITW